MTETYIMWWNIDNSPTEGIVSCRLNETVGVPFAATEFHVPATEASRRLWQDSCVDSTPFTLHRDVVLFEQLVLVLHEVFHILVKFLEALLRTDRRTTNNLTGDVCFSSGRILIRKHE